MSKKDGNMYVTVSNNNVDAHSEHILESMLRQNILVVVSFRVRGNLRFLSHSEMMRLFQRACVRTGVDLAYSHGFNPHPKISLPLPRSVGIESDCELLSVRVDSAAPTFDSSNFKTRFSYQLPAGCQLLAVKVEAPNTSLQPSLVTYVLRINQTLPTEQLEARIKQLMSSKSLELERYIDKKDCTITKDVKPFLKSVELDGRKIVAECKITPAGSIRVGEIFKLLELDADNLAAPIRRTAIRWQRN